MNSDNFTLAQEYLKEAADALKRLNEFDERLGTVEEPPPRYNGNATTVLTKATALTNLQ